MSASAPSPHPAPPSPVTRSFVQRIAGPPRDVFPLLCPVREAEWLDGWTAEVLRSRSGVAEEGCVFRTTAPGDPETVWFVTRHEPEAGRVDFARVTPGRVATRLVVRVEAAGAGESRVHVTYEFTPTSPEGERVVSDRHSAEAFRASMEWWQRSMNHFLETGERLPKSSA